MLWRREQVCHVAPCRQPTARESRTGLGPDHHSASHRPSSGRRGDLYLTINLDSHPLWKLDGDVLRAELPLSPAEAVLGGEVKVPTPDGEAVVTVPAGISSGRSLRLRGKGWPLKAGRGDLLLTVQLQLPNQPSDAERQLYQQLRDLPSDNPRDSLFQNARL